MAEVRLTSEGIAKYEEKLEHLKTVRRTEIAEQIKIARAFGDLSENAEYDAAKNEQARNEYEIVEIETLLRNAVLIDEENIDTHVVNIGATVRVKNMDLNEEFEYQIVGSAEADPMDGRISNESPIGKALLGHSIGEDIEIATPGGLIRMQVLAIGK